MKNPSMNWTEFLAQLGPSGKRFSYSLGKQDLTIFDQVTWDLAWKTGCNTLTITEKNLKLVDEESEPITPRGAENIMEDHEETVVATETKIDNS